MKNKHEQNGGRVFPVPGETTINMRSHVIGRPCSHSLQALAAGRRCSIRRTSPSGTVVKNAELCRLKRWRLLLIFLVSTTLFSRCDSTKKKRILVSLYRKDAKLVKNLFLISLFTHTGLTSNK